jgi:hypothetical protein
MPKDEDDEIDGEDEADEAAEDEDAVEEEDASEPEDEPALAEEQDDEGDESDGEDEADEAADDEDEYEPPELDEGIFGGRHEHPDAADEDFEEDAGDWTDDDYRETASKLFGGHDFFGQNAERAREQLGYQRWEHDEAWRGELDRHAPGVSRTVKFYEREGAVRPLGFMTLAALEALAIACPQLDFGGVHVTIPGRRRRPEELDGPASVPAAPVPPLPPALASTAVAEKVDLRKFATPVGDQKQTSRCAAFAWTHALELAANLLGEPVPRLAPSYSMLQFQKQQGDFKDYKYAYKGGDGTSGTVEPGEVLTKLGTCRQELWPDDHPHPKADDAMLAADAKNFRLRARLVEIQLDDLKRVLSAGCPVQLNMTTGEAFADIGRDGLFDAAEKPSGDHGYHAMLCVGFVGNYFIVKNSWGTDWGDRGYCYVPKKVLASSEPELVAILLERSRATSGPPAAPSAASTAHPSAAPLAAPIPALAPAPPALAAPTVRCPACAQVVRAAAFCEECGGKLEVVTCSACHALVSKGGFCAECGHALAPPPRFCRSCGHMLRPGGRFCEACGAQVGA